MKKYINVQVGFAVRLMTMALVMGMKCLTVSFSVCHGVNQRVGRIDSCVYVGCFDGNKPLPSPPINTTYKSEAPKIVSNRICIAAK